MKRSLMFLSALLLFSSMAMASPSYDSSWGSDWDKDHHHHHHKGGDPKAVPELGVVPMLALSFATMAGGLTLKRRRSAKTVD
jgi:hypothetical protein